MGDGWAGDEKEGGKRPVLLLNAPALEEFEPTINCDKPEYACENPIPTEVNTEFKPLELLLELLLPLEEEELFPYGDDLAAAAASSSSSSPAVGRKLYAPKVAPPLCLSLPAGAPAAPASDEEGGRYDPPLVLPSKPLGPAPLPRPVGSLFG